MTDRTDARIRAAYGQARARLNPRHICLYCEHWKKPGIWSNVQASLDVGVSPEGFRGWCRRGTPAFPETRGSDTCGSWERATDHRWNDLTNVEEQP